MRYFIIFILLLSGCSQPSTMADLKQFVRDKEQQPAQSLKPLETLTSYEPFSYSVSNMRSPFAPPITEVAAQSNKGMDIKPDFDRPKQFLENFVISDLKVIGFLKNSQKSYGLIQHNGLVYKVKVGDYLGKDYGKIVEVTEQGVRLVEIVAVGNKAWIKRPQLLEITR